MDRRLAVADSVGRGHAAASGLRASAARTPLAKAIPIIRDCFVHRQDWIAWTNEASGLSPNYLKRRNFSCKPWLAGHPNDQPGWAPTGFAPTPAYTYTHHSGFTRDTRSSSRCPPELPLHPSAPPNRPARVPDRDVRTSKQIPSGCSTGWTCLHFAAD